MYIDKWRKNGLKYQTNTHAIKPGSFVNNGFFYYS